MPKAVARTHKGNIRSGNEDSFFCDNKLGLWLVADGMGGHEAGEVASALVVEAVENEIKKGSVLADSIQFSHQSVLDNAAEGKGASGMGSTVVALQKTGNNNYQVGWVGDSRAYLWTQKTEESGDLQQLSTDHSYVQALLQSGAISEEDLETHPDKNIITQCLGSLELKQVKVDTIDGEWQENQKILLCSDGLTDELSDSDIATILNESIDSNVVIDLLIEESLKHGGKDNITVILIDSPIRNSGNFFANIFNQFRAIVDKARK